MKTVTIQISDRDFADMVQFFAKDGPGRPLIAVTRLVAVDGDPDFDLLHLQEEADEILAGHEPR